MYVESVDQVFDQHQMHIPPLLVPHHHLGAHLLRGVGKGVKPCIGARIRKWKVSVLGEGGEHIAHKGRFAQAGFTHDEDLKVPVCQNS